MPAQPYATVATFFGNADAYSIFLKRVTARLVEWAVAEREESTPEPVTAAWVARQEFACAVLTGETGAVAKARMLLPALAVKANAAGLIAADGTITATDAQILATVAATDAQILATVADALIDVHAGYVPPTA